ncbi:MULTISPECIES: hypothetical protein [Bacillales]|uniref:DUF2197 domain-containing protein n=1 Tax=Bacillus bingmayongensis TaxID=1150157 RepID=A0ABU5K4M8_9BACI|nr:hypothetical protein [Bacillus bingmayongensis]MBY0598651.1 hypothetical protein [Bacillus bingmayongensis]MDZ5610623.1 hypothetical protein [Bacillus pseudomycoides]
MPHNKLFYEVICMSCRQIFKVYEGTQIYKRFKENRKGKYNCEQCSHNIQLEAIKNFFNKY